MDKSLISPGSVKTINVSKEDYDRITTNTKYLRGNQPVGRTTIKPLDLDKEKQRYGATTRGGIGVSQPV